MKQVKRKLSDVGILHHQKGVITKRRALKEWLAGSRKRAWLGSHFAKGLQLAFAAWKGAIICCLWSGRGCGSILQTLGALGGTLDLLSACGCFASLCFPPPFHVVPLRCAHVMVQGRCEASCRLLHLGKVGHMYTGEDRGIDANKNPRNPWVYLAYETKPRLVGGLIQNLTWQWARGHFCRCWLQSIQARSPTAMGQKSDFDLIELNGLKTKVINAPECKVLQSIATKCVNSRLVGKSHAVGKSLVPGLGSRTGQARQKVCGQHLQYCIELPRHQKKSRAWCTHWAITFWRHPHQCVYTIYIYIIIIIMIIIIYIYMHAWNYMSI